MRAGPGHGARQAINLDLGGPDGGTRMLEPGDELWTVSLGTDPAAPTAHGDPHSFVAWGTKRADWRDHVRLEAADDTAGADAAAVLDAINVI